MASALSCLSNQLFAHKYLIVFLSVLFTFQSAYSQVDTTYVKPFGHPLSLRTYLLNPFTALTYEVENKIDRTYRPNNPFGIGLGFTYKKISMSGSYGFDFMRDKRKGKTKSLDFQYHHYASRYTVDIFFQNYKGFFTAEDGEGTVYRHFPDIKLIQYGLFAQYVFNGKKFSYMAAFDQNERQLKSAGTLLAGVGAYYNYARSDSSLVFLNNKNTDRNFQIGVSAGYAYTWVINSHVFVSGSLSAGVNFGSETINRFGKDRFKVYPTMFPRFSTGYNHNNWSVGLSAILNRVYLNYSDKQSMSFDTGQFQLTYIKRFSVMPKILRDIGL